MSKSVDNKVVSLDLDNKKFMGKASEVLGALSRLKEAMNFKSASGAFDAVAKNAPVEQINQLSGSVEKVSGRFSVLGGAAAVALGGIAAKAIQAGATLLSSFTLAPIMDGFREYQSQLDSVQTVLANTSSKGETIATVNAALDELNTYADRTIYNFGEMTRNVGTFTAAGVGLSDSVAAIKGFSNVAAAMGANSENTARGMYQLSQALATGTVRLLDWNSIANAGMGGEQFQEALKRTARNHGKAVDDMIAKEGSFRESLKLGWLDSSVMIETLKQYTGDLSREQLLNMGYTEQQTEEILKMGQTANDAATKVKTFSQLIGNIQEALGSGWAAIFRVIFGDFERARNLWTGVANAIGGAIDTFMGGILNILKRWDELGGWFDLWEGLGSLLRNVARPITEIGSGIVSMFKGDAGKALADFTSFFRNSIADWLSMSDTLANDFRNIGKAIGTVLSFASGALLTVIKLVTVVSVNLVKFAMTILGFVIRPVAHLFGRIGQLTEKFQDWVRSLTNGLSPIASLNRYLERGISIVGQWVDRWVAFMNLGIDKVFDAIDRSLPSLNQKVMVLVNVFKAFGYIIKDSLGVAVDKISKFTEQINVLGKLKDVLSPVGKRLDSLFGGKVTALGDNFKQMVEGTESSLRRTGVTIEKLQNGRSLFDNASLEITNALAKRTEDRMSNLRLEIDALKRVAGMIKDYFVDMFRAPAREMDNFENGIKRIRQVNDNLSSMHPALKKIGDAAKQTGAQASAAFSGMGKTASSVGGWIRSNLGSVPGEIGNAFQKFGFIGGILYTVTSAVIGLAKAIFDLVKIIGTGLADAGRSIKKFVSESEILQQVRKNVGGMVTTMGNMLSNLGSRLAHAFDGVSLGDILRNVLGVGILGIIAKGLWKFFKSINGTVGGVGGIVEKLGDIFESVTKHLKAMTQEVQAKALKNIAVSVLILAGALFILASIPTKQLISATVALGVISAELVATMKLMSMLKIPTKKIATIGIFALLLSASVLLLSFAARTLGKLSVSEITKGLTAVMVLIGGMTAAAKLIGSSKKTILKGTALIVAMALAIRLMTKPIYELGSMDVGTLTQGLISLGLILGGLTLAIVGISKLGNSAGITLSAAFLLLSIAQAMRGISEAVKQFGEMDTGALVQGIIAMTASIGVLIGVLRFMPKSAGLSALSLLVLVVSLSLVAKVINGFAQYEWGSLLQSVLKMSVVLAVLIGLSFLASKASFGALSFIGLSIAVWLLAKAIKQFDDISAGTIAKALIAVAAAFAIFLAAAAGAGLVAPGILVLLVALAALALIPLVLAASLTALSLALGLFGAAVIAAGTAIGTGFAAMAAGIAAGSKLLIAVAPDLKTALKNVGTAVAEGVSSFGAAALALIASLAPAVSTAISNICAIIVQRAPELLQSVFALVTAFCQQLITTIPVMVETFVTVVSAVIDGLIQLLPKFGELAIQMVTTLCQVLISSIPQLADAALQCLVGLLEAIRDNIGRVVSTGLEVMGAFIEGLASGMVELVNAAFRAVITFINGLADAFDRYGPQLNSAVERLINSIFNWLHSGMSGMGNRLWGSLTSLGTNLVHGIWNGVSGAWGRFTSWLSGLAQGAINRVKSIFGIHSPSRVFAEIGKFLVLGLGVGAKRNANQALDTMGRIANDVIDTFDVNADYEPVIKPVVDDSAIRSFANESFENAKYSVGFDSYNDRVALRNEFAALRDELKGQRQMVFNQYNNSPQELSLEALHNQTVSQLAYIRGVV